MDHVDERTPDGGFTLVEVVVSLLVVATVSASLSYFFLSGLRQTRHQGQQQAALQFALDGIERARGLRGATVLTGRAPCSACPQTVAVGAAAHLVGTARYDGPVSGVVPLLPFADQAIVEGLTYTRHWYVGKCYRSSGEDCGSSVSTAVFYRVVVAVTWPGQECAGTCSQVTSTLFTANPTDPLFQAS
jgi:prepilin-type N-terminal cleavage/methylation domain-containing protein